MRKSPFEQEPAVEQMTGPQRRYLEDLLVKRGTIKGMDAEKMRAVLTDFLSTIDKSRASRMIDKVKAENVRLEQLFAPLRRDAVKAVELEDGMYLVENAVWKVYHTVHGRNEQVAKEFMQDGSIGDEVDSGEFVYRGKAPLAYIRSMGRRMTLEEAREFGAVYGICCRCSATLTDELSIALGMGPVCGNREFGESFKVLLKSTRQTLKVSA